MKIFALCSYILFLFPSVCWSKSHRKRKNDHPGARSARFLNRSGAKVDFFWIHPQTGELTHSHTSGEGVVWGAETGINTFVGHRFEVVELEAGTSGKCMRRTCRTTQFEIGPNEDQIFTLNEHFEVTVEDNRSRSLEKARQALDSCQRDPNLPVEEQITSLATCMEKQVQKALNETQNEIEFQAALRKNMGKDLLNYSCEDPKMKTTESYRNESWTFMDPATQQSKEHEVQVLFETERTAVKYIPGMLTIEQCELLLSKTTTVADKGGTSTRILPTSAKTYMPTVQILMKIQNLYKSFLGLSVSFSSEPLLTFDSVYPAEPAMAEGECAVCDEAGNDKDKAKACAERSDNAPAGVTLKSLSSENDENMKEPSVVTTTLLLTCSTGQGSGFHFPRTGTHVATRQPGDAILVVHRDSDTGLSEKEPFLDNLAICQPWSGEFVFAVHQHRIYFKDA